MKKIISVFSMLFLVAAGTVFADKLYMKNGEVKVVDKAWEQGEMVHFLVGGKQLTVPKNMVVKIEAGNNAGSTPGGASGSSGKAGAAADAQKKAAEAVNKGAKKAAGGLK